MQKLIKISIPNDNDLLKFEEKYLEKGWIIKQMVTYDTNVLVFLLEKDTRKEKMENLQSIATKEEVYAEIRRLVSEIIKNEKI